jgi:ribosome-dependent ATPase
VIAGLFTILGKELRHIRHDPLTLAVAAGVPMLQLILFGFAVQPRVEHVPTAVLNHDHHARSRALIEKLQKSRMFAIRENTADQASLQKMLRAGRVKAAIEIPEDFSANELYRRPSNLRIWVDQSEVLTALQVASAAEAAGVTESLERLVPSRLSADATPIVRVDVSAPNRGDWKTSTSLIPGLLGILLNMIPLLLTGLSIVKEKERGTWDQLLVTPMSGWSLIGGKLLAYGMVGFLEGCVLVALMITVFGIRIEGSLLLLLFSIALFLVPSVGLGLLITNWARHQAQALQMTYLIFLPSILISGFLFPRDSMPGPIYFLSCLLPTTYFIRIMRGVIVRGATFVDLLPEFGAVFVFAGLSLVLTWGVVRGLRKDGPER